MKFADDSNLGKVERCGGEPTRVTERPEMQVRFNTGKHKVISTAEKTKLA